MSQVDRYRGTAQKIEFPKGVDTFKEKITFLQGRGNVFEDLDDDEDFWSDTVERIGEDFYELKKIAVSEYSISAEADKDGLIHFDLCYYNGGCSFGEAFESAIEAMEREARYDLQNTPRL